MVKASEKDMNITNQLSFSSADWGVHPLNNPVHSTSRHYQSVMQQDAIDIQTLEKTIGPLVFAA